MNFSITLFQALAFFLIGVFAGNTFGKETETNSSKLSELELAKRDAKDFKNLASLIKPSVVVIESVDRNGYEGGRGTGFVVQQDGVIATNFMSLENIVIFPSVFLMVVLFDPNLFWQSTAIAILLL